MKPYDTLLQHFFDVRSEQKQKPHPERIMYDCTATIIYDNWHWKIKQGYMGDPDVPKYTNFHYLRKLHSGAQIVGELVLEETTLYSVVFSIQCRNQITNMQQVDSFTRTLSCHSPYLLFCWHQYAYAE